MSDGHGDATALGVTWRDQPAARTGYGPDPGCQPCPDCGGLECLCRPRFFAGQLLTEQDLNRLDHYIVEKNKLHNRHLVGWGVVCGLEVLCDQCEERVRVTPGYAISPCGEDIVVCKPDYVDICALIDRCRKGEDLDCRPYAGQDGCEEVEEEWVLAIRFMEAPSRGMTALTGTSSCACGGKSKCGCGGCGGCGCSCAGTAAPEAKNEDAPKLRRGAPPACEPTVVCETYRYEIFRKPEDEEEDEDKDKGEEDDGFWIVGSLSGVFDKLDGELARRISCCLKDLEKSIPKPPGDTQTPMTEGQKQAWYRWACAVKRSLAAYYARIGGGNCEAVAKLAAIQIPPPTMELDAFQQALGMAMMQLMLVALEAMLHCVCSNLLPPCPAPEDPRVPLAVVTVRRKGCDIVKVCNWTPLRRHVTTFRSLDYWFGWLPLRRKVREAIEQVCCNLFDLFDQFEFKDSTTPDEEDMPQDSIKTVEIGEAAPLDKEKAADAADPFGAPVTLQLGRRRGRTRVLGRAALASLGNDAPLRAADLFEVTFGRPRFASGDFADPEDERQATERLAQSGLVRTFAEVVRATGVTERVGDLLGAFGGAAVARGGGSSLRGGGEMAEMRARLDRQDAEIAELRRSLGAAGPAGKS